MTTKYTLARVEFDADGRPPTSRPLIMPARLQTDPAGRPGGWSVVLEFIGTPDFAKIRFLAPGAPHHELREGEFLELYEGPRRVARVRVLRSAFSEGDKILTHDVDVLKDRKAAPRIMEVDQIKTWLGWLAKP